MAIISQLIIGKEGKPFKSITIRVEDAELKGEVEIPFLADFYSVGIKDGTLTQSGAMRAAEWFVDATINTDMITESHHSETQDLKNTWERGAQARICPGFVQQAIFRMNAESYLKRVPRISPTIPMRQIHTL